MRRFLCILCALTLSLTLCACAAEKPENREAAPETGKIQTAESGEKTQPEKQMPGQTAAYSCGYANMTVTLPEGWDYKIVEAGPTLLSGTEDGRFGIRFWPEKKPEMTVSLLYSTQQIGLCGTGVTFEDVQLENGRKATKCTSGESGGSFWFCLIYTDVPGNYMAEGSFSRADWAAYGTDVLEILTGAELGAGSMDRVDAVAQAETAYAQPYAHAYAEFDYKTGQWTVELRDEDGNALYNAVFNGADETGKTAQTPVQTAG